jgi:RNA recognition motif-containing protein
VSEKTLGTKFGVFLFRRKKGELFVFVQYKGMFSFLEKGMMKLFVGNLSWSATEDALRAAFEAFGKVLSVKIVTDPYTGRSKGFGFVEMEDEATADEAIRQLNESPFLNRPLRVSKARQEQRGPRQGRPMGGQREYGRRHEHASFGRDDD